MNFLIVTGLSGAGKSQSIKILEDLGYFCIDNLPPKLVTDFAEMCKQHVEEFQKVAIGMDIRGGYFFNEMLSALDEFELKGHKYEILFLDASDETLIKRFKQTRRKHPLSPEGRISKGITLERGKLTSVKRQADNIIDTTNMSGKELKDELTFLYVEGGKSAGLIVNLLSFGFKYGLPIDADMVFDVRFLPNPYYIAELSKKSGLDKEIQNYICSFPESALFLDKVEDIVEFLIPGYLKEGKSQLIIAIGCTGGRHRSVALSEFMAERLKINGHRVKIEHRDINEENYD